MIPCFSLCKDCQIILNQTSPFIFRFPFQTSFCIHSLLYAFVRLHHFPSFGQKYLCHSFHVLFSKVIAFFYRAIFPGEPSFCCCMYFYLFKSVFFPAILENSFVRLAELLGYFWKGFIVIIFVSLCLFHCSFIIIISLFQQQQHNCGLQQTLKMCVCVLLFVFCGLTSSVSLLQCYLQF